MISQQKASIIIPAYNEERRIGNTLKEYSLFFDDLKKKKIMDYEIIVVINNTKDKTEDIVKKYQKTNKNIICLNFKEGGKGFAITEGFKDSLKRKNDLIGFVDADMATPPEAFYDLIKNIGEYDGIIASRYVKGAVVTPKRTIQRFIASRAFNLPVRILFFMKFRDTQCGAKMFKRKTVEKIVNKLSITQWAFDVNILYVCKKNKLIIKEHATKWVDREYSKINLKKAGLQMFSSIVRLRLINSPFKNIVGFYDKMPEKIKIHHR